jgi:hypothetical protein
VRSPKYDYQLELIEAQQAVATAELEATKKYVLALLPEIPESLMHQVVHQVVHDVTERLTANRQFTSEVTRDERRMCLELRVRLEYDIT